jgi:hypothetical protein
LPPGIQLGEGETLVPGRITFEDANGPAIDFPAEAPAKLPVPVKRASEKTPDLKADALDDPFSQVTPTPSGNFTEATESFLSDLPEQETATPIDLVPKNVETPVSTNVAEPTQDEIDSVIEEIFGRPDRQATSNEAVESPANNQSMQFLFD